MAKQSLPVATSDAKELPTKEQAEREKKYRAEDALRDIERAEGYKADKNLMKYVKKLAKEKVNCLKKIC